MVLTRAQLSMRKAIPNVDARPEAVSIRAKPFEQDIIPYLMLEELKAIRRLLESLGLR